jgi:succinoglycan biosynthesis protein ExoA
MNELPLVSVVIPARNEQADLSRCLDAVLAQDYPLDRMEVLLVDGGSTDRTAEIAEANLIGSDLARVEILPNPVGTTPSNLNLGLAHAKGEIVCRIDARSIVPHDYVRRCTDVLLQRPDVAVTGGRQEAQPRDGSTLSIGIARALNNGYGMGLSRYRRGAGSGESDTVYLGAFRVDQLRAVGGWDERLHINQDFDLNRRLARFGTIWFQGGLDVGYLPRPDLASLWRQYERFGRGKVRYWRVTGTPMRMRQAALLAFPPVALASSLLLLLTGDRRRRWATSVLALAGAVLFETKGSSGPPGPPPARVVSMAASSVVGLGWWTGVVRGWLSKGRGGS